MNRTIARHVGLIIGDMGLTGERSPASAFKDWTTHCREAKALDAATLDEIQKELEVILAPLSLMAPMPGYHPFAVLSIVRSVLAERMSNERRGNGAPTTDAAAIDRLVRVIAETCGSQISDAVHLFLCRSVRNELGIPWYVNAYAQGETTGPAVAAYARPLASVRVATVPEELQAIGRMLVDDYNHNLRPNEQIHVASEPMPCLTWKGDAENQ